MFRKETMMHNAVSRSISTLGLATLVALASATATATPAAAATAVQQAPVPSCVVAVEWRPSITGKAVTVYSNCSYQVHFKVINAWGPDSPCLIVNRGGGQKTWRWARGHQSFDGLRRC
ncbi:hypothetical protein ACIBQ1_07805 [Nonomuraea sp. NPDC050153]|uniref:hypothetical protein n=1 Tax=Nonomuraea sp. NPDC050153 TaxID=3364359 RepID=UPI0037BBD5E5